MRINWIFRYDLSFVNVIKQNLPIEKSFYIVIFE